MTDALRSLVDQFVQDLTAAIEANVLDAVRSGLQGAGTPIRGRGGKGASRGAGSPTAARAKGQKRDPRELEALAGKLRAYIAKNPGQRIEQIGKGMGVATKDLALPAKKLLAAKQLSTKGQKRATTYYPKG
jgi:hypothetical protein